jgi:hypothetical protein
MNSSRETTLTLLAIAFLAILIFMAVWNRKHDEPYRDLSKNLSGNRLNGEKCKHFAAGLCYAACGNSGANIDECYFCDTQDPEELLPMSLGAFPEDVQQILREKCYHR